MMCSEQVGIFGLLTPAYECGSLTGFLWFLSLFVLPLFIVVSLFVIAIAVVRAILVASWEAWRGRKP